MAKYTRFRTLFEVSDTSDFAKADVYATEETATTATKVRLKELISAALTPGTVLSLAHLVTCPRLQITNKDASNFVTITYQTNSGGATTQTKKLLAGKTCVLRDIRAVASVVQNVTLVADTAACDVEVSYEGT
jgi:hypothetical protein